MWKRRRKKRAVPRWAPFGSAAQYRAFLEVVEQALVDRELEAAVGDGVVAVRLADDRPLQIGLQSLAQHCHLTEPEQWPPLVAAHLDAVLGAETEAQAFDHTQFDRVRSRLKVRLYPADALDQDETLEVVQRRPTPGLALVLAYDHPHTVLSVPPSHLAHWGQPEDALFELALENTGAEPVTGERIPVARGLHLDALTGQSLFVASHLMLMERHLPKRLPYGALVSVPTRHQLLFHPIRDARVLMVCNVLIPQTYVRYRQGPGSISPNLYWWREGQLTWLPTCVGPEAVKFTPPESFVNEVMVPLGGVEDFH